jgi:hypothetical protein
MGLKGYSLWVMGQLESNVQSPTVGVKGSVDRVASFAFLRYAMTSPVSQFAACFAGAPCA